MGIFFPFCRDSGLKLGGERDGGLGLARFWAICPFPLGGNICANGKWPFVFYGTQVSGMAGAACMGLTT
jgi:hypothetical protein